MRKVYLLRLLVLVSLAMAHLMGGCTVGLDGSFDIIESELDTEYTEYQSLVSAVALYNPTIPDYENFHWDESDSAFVQWKRALEDLVAQVPQLQNSWNAATLDERNQNQARYDAVKNRLTQLLTRGVLLKVVVEPWTVYLMTVTKSEWVTASANLAGATNAFFGTSIPAPGWIVDFLNDRMPHMNSGIGLRAWSMLSDTFCQGSGATSRCPLNDKAPIALREGLDEDGWYLHQETQTSSLNLGFTSTPDRAVWFERAPGKTGPLTYNESLALHVEGEGYIKYEHHTVGVSLSTSSTPSYEWEIRPQWAQMSGQWVDTRLHFGIENLNRPGLLSGCDQTLGADLGWITNPDETADVSADCE